MADDRGDTAKYDLAFDAATAFHKAVVAGSQPADYYNSNVDTQTAVLNTFERNVVPLQIENTELKLDGLLGSTGVESKEAMNRWLAGEVKSWTQNSRESHAKKLPQGYVFMLVDLDGLKQINGDDKQGSKRGHDMGDAALFMLGRALTSVSRVEDRIARIGGDEFLVVMEARPDSSKSMMERKGGVLDRLRGLVDAGRNELIALYGDRWPKGDGNRRLAEASVGWEFLTRDQIIEKYREFQNINEQEKMTNLAGYLSRGADAKMYEDKSRERN